MRIAVWVTGALALAALIGPTARPGAADEPPIVIGMELGLSPPADPGLGQLCRRGAEIGVEYVNDVLGGVLGRKVQISVQDTQAKNEAGIAAYRRLVTEEKAVVVSGFAYSSENIAVNEVAKELGVPTLSSQAGAADVTAKHYDVAFRTHAIDPLRAATWLGWIKKMNYKKISILAVTTDYGIGLISETENQNKAKKLGLEIQSLTYDQTVNDLTPQLLQVKAFKPDAILNVGVGQMLDLMVDQAATLGLQDTPMLISYDAPVRPQWWQLHAQDGLIYFIAYYSPQQKLSDIGTWYAKRYQEKFKDLPVYSDLNCFADIAIIAQAITQAKSTDPNAITTALETGKFTGWAAGDVTFPRTEGVFWHNWSPPMQILHYTKPNQDWRTAEVAYSPPAN
ncbi:MAG TPA: ABC transporter substrate-binding protein [Stellaceae bacterium]|nr:ABC transporter substrate-binding protein [Stellaceae bacterium]